MPRFSASDRASSILWSELYCEGIAMPTTDSRPSASAAMSCVASCFDFGAADRRKVVTTALDFPSMGYLWEAQRRVGAEVHVVPSDDDISVSTDRIRPAPADFTSIRSTPSIAKKRFGRSATRT